MSEIVGFIGTGMIGGALARLSVAAGYRVILSNSRGPESLTQFVKELGPLARAATREEVAAGADLVIATVPLSAYSSLPAVPLTGKIVIDTMNYYPQARDGGVERLDQEEVTSSELIQEHLSGSVVVKALHNLDFHHLLVNARPAGHPERTTLPVAGDNEDAVEKVSAFMQKIGYDAVHVASLQESWRIEPGTPVYVWPYVPQIPESLSPAEARTWYIQHPGMPLSASDVKSLTDSTTRVSPPGGSPAELPQTHVQLVGEVYARRSQG